MDNNLFEQAKNDDILSKELIFTGKYGIQPIEFY